MFARVADASSRRGFISLIASPCAVEGYQHPVAIARAGNAGVSIARCAHASF